MVKKFLAVLLCAVMVFGSVAVGGNGIAGLLGAASVKASAEDELTEGIYTYTVNNGEAWIIACAKSASGAVTIPSTLGGYPVTSIEDVAFGYCTSLTSVTIPDGVTYIGVKPFADCYSLTEITVDPNNPNYSNDDFGVFFNKDKNALIKYPEGNTRKNYTIPDGVMIIGDYAFDGCESLASVTIPDSVTSIGEGAFSVCRALTSVTVPGCVTSIGDYAFWACDNLPSVNIPDSVTYIGVNSFYCCDSLAEITVDPNNPNYSNDGFGVLFNKDKTELIKYPAGNARTSYTIPDSVTSIGNDAFDTCCNLTSITIGNSVTSIGDHVFVNCNFTSITIPEGVTSIGLSAFWGCFRLTSVTIPKSLTSIDYGVFSTCYSLNDVYYSGTLADRNNIDIPDNELILLKATWHYDSIFDTIISFFYSIYYSILYWVSNLNIPLP